MENTYDEIMLALQSSQIQELSIIKISEPIASAIQQASGTRTSDVSRDAFESPSPSSLEADLSHYKVSILSVAIGSNANLERNSSPNSVSHISSKSQKRNLYARSSGTRQ
jgi:hypothetical protein